MPTVRFDEHFAIERHVAGLSNRAYRAHMEAICWSVRNSTDGYIPAGRLREASRLTRRSKCIDELTARGVWLPAEGGWNLPQGADGTTWWSVERDDTRKVPDLLRHAVFSRDGRRCLKCGSTEDLTLDHIYPWSLGGKHTMDNLRVLCRSCNSSKGARLE